MPRATRPFLVALSLLLLLPACLVADIRVSGNATIPDVIGVKFKQAVFDLTLSGFDIQVETDWDSDFNQRGKITKQQPTGGTSAQKGSSVTIWFLPDGKRLGNWEGTWVDGTYTVHITGEEEKLEENGVWAGDVPVGQGGTDTWKNFKRTPQNTWLGVRQLRYWDGDKILTFNQTIELTLGHDEITTKVVNLADGTVVEWKKGVTPYPLFPWARKGAESASHLKRQKLEKSSGNGAAGEKANKKRVADMTPAEFAADKSAQKELFEIATKMRDLQLEFAKRWLANNGIPFTGTEAMTRLKRDNLEGEDNFVDGVLKKCQRNKYDRIGRMDDIARGRFNLHTWDQVNKIVASIVDDPSTTNIVVAQVEPPRRGSEETGYGYPRWHIVMEDTVTGLRFEWQIGAAATTTLYETPGIELPSNLTLPQGMHSDIHDIEYDIFRVGIKLNYPDLHAKWGLQQIHDLVDAASARTGVEGDKFLDMDTTLRPPPCDRGKAGNHRKRKRPRLAGAVLPLAAVTGGTAARSKPNPFLARSKVSQHDRPTSVEHARLKELSLLCPECGATMTGTGRMHYNPTIRNWLIEYRCPKNGETYEIYTPEAARLAKELGENSKGS